MLKLIIDYGNTQVKAAVFKGDNLTERRIFSGDPLAETKSLLKQYPAAQAIISSVSDRSADLAGYLERNMDLFINLDHTTSLPVRNMYRSPESLGYDRIAAAAGAYTIFPGSDVLIIDAGTAITIDFLNRKGEFTGGNISPGRKMRAMAMHQYTSRLPLVKTEGEVPLLADSTYEALRAGILNGITFELQGYIEQLNKKHAGLKIILTGGDAKYFDKKLKYSIFVDSNLNLTGLNCILEHNAQQK